MSFRSVFFESDFLSSAVAAHCCDIYGLVKYMGSVEVVLSHTAVFSLFVSNETAQKCIFLTVYYIHWKIMKR